MWNLKKKVSKQRQEQTDRYGGRTGDCLRGGWWRMDEIGEGN